MDQHASPIDAGTSEARPPLGRCPACGSDSTQKLSLFVKSRSWSASAVGVGVDSRRRLSLSGGLLSARSALVREKATIPAYPIVVPEKWVKAAKVFPLSWPLLPILMWERRKAQHPDRIRQVAEQRAARARKIALLRNGWTCLRCGDDWLPAPPPSEASIQVSAPDSTGARLHGSHHEDVEHVPWIVGAFDRGADRILRWHAIAARHVTAARAPAQKAVRYLPPRRTLGRVAMILLLLFVGVVVVGAVLRVTGITGPAPTTHSRSG